MGKLERFAREQAIEPDVPEPRARFDAMLDAMAKPPAKSSKRGGKTSPRDDDAC